MKMKVEKRKQKMEDKFTRIEVNKQKSCSWSCSCSCSGEENDEVERVESGKLENLEGHPCKWSNLSYFEQIWWD